MKLKNTTLFTPILSAKSRSSSTSLILYLVIVIAIAWLMPNLTAFSNALTALFHEPSTPLNQSCFLGDALSIDISTYLKPAFLAFLKNSISANFQPLVATAAYIPLSAIALIIMRKCG